MQEISRQIAKYPGICYECGQPIYVNDYVIIYELPLGKKVAKHVNCVLDSGAGS